MGAIVTGTIRDVASMTMFKKCGMIVFIRDSGAIVGPGSASSLVASAPMEYNDDQAFLSVSTLLELPQALESPDRSLSFDHIRSISSDELVIP